MPLYCRHLFRGKDYSNSQKCWAGMKLWRFLLKTDVCIPYHLFIFHLVLVKPLRDHLNYIAHANTHNKNNQTCNNFHKTMSTLGSFVGKVDDDDVQASLTFGKKSKGNFAFSTEVISVRLPTLIWKITLDKNE